MHFGILTHIDLPGTDAFLPVGDLLVDSDAVEEALQVINSTEAFLSELWYLLRQVERV